jgi:hypothetical protein
LHVFVPLFLFINKKENDKLDLYYLLLFSLILVPKSYYNIKPPGYGSVTDVNIGIVLNPLFMVAILAMVVIQGIRRVYSQLMISKSG